MGVIYSIPLCSRGEAAKNNDENVAAAVDKNNNLPTSVVVSQQPQPTSLTNPNAEDEQQRPEATSTPKSDRTPGPILDAGIILQPANNVNRASVSPSIESEGHIEIPEDEEDISLGDTSRSDSGLEQSSSDELELGPAVPNPHHAQSNNNNNSGPPSFAAMLAAEQLEEAERPLSAAGHHHEDEGINEETLDVTIPLENHETCEEDEDEDEAEDPVERPPEPTVPDERVDSAASSSHEGSPGPSNAGAAEAEIRAAGRRKTGANDTTSAISNIFSEIIGDRPYDQQQQQQGLEVHHQGLATGR